MWLQVGPWLFASTLGKQLPLKLDSLASLSCDSPSYLKLSCLLFNLHKAEIVCFGAETLIWVSLQYGASGTVCHRYSHLIVLKYVYKYKCLENNAKWNRERGKQIQTANLSNSQRNETNRSYYFPKLLSDNLMRRLKANLSLFPVP